MSKYEIYIHFNTCMKINAYCYQDMTTIKHCFKTNTSWPLNFLLIKQNFYMGMGHAGEPCRGNLKLLRSQKGTVRNYWTSQFYGIFLKIVDQLIEYYLMLLKSHKNVCANKLLSVSEPPEDVYLLLLSVSVTPINNCQFFQMCVKKTWKLIYLLVHVAFMHN